MSAPTQYTANGQYTNRESEYRKYSNIQSNRDAEYRIHKYSVKSGVRISNTQIGSKDTYTGWRRCIRCLKSEVSLRKRATICRALLRKMPYKDKVFGGSSPPCAHTADPNTSCARAHTQTHTHARAYAYKYVLLYGSKQRRRREVADTHGYSCGYTCVVHDHPYTHTNTHTSLTHTHPHPPPHFLSLTHTQMKDTNISYGLAMISRLLKITGPFCRI